MGTNFNGTMINQSVTIAEKAGADIADVRNLILKYDEDGNLYFCGRKDFQIKHMGHRIELEEIEKHMAGMEGVDRCICVYDDEKKRLYAYYTGSCDKKEIYAYMKEKLPVYMIPNVIQRVEELKLNKNGKIDRSIYRKDLS